MLNNLKLARQYVPRKVDVDLLYFHATEMTGDLDGILDRSPSAWRRSSMGSRCMNWPAITRPSWIRFRQLRSPADCSSGSPFKSQQIQWVPASIHQQREVSPRLCLMDRSMHKPIVIFTIGTQGDVRPCVALGQGLQRAGYPVRIATSGNFAGLVRGQVWSSIL